MSRTIAFLTFKLKSQKISNGFYISSNTFEFRILHEYTRCALKLSSRICGNLVPRARDPLDRGAKGSGMVHLLSPQIVDIMYLLLRMCRVFQDGWHANRNRHYFSGYTFISRNKHGDCVHLRDMKV